MFDLYEILFQHRDGGTEIMTIPPNEDAWRTFALFASSSSSDIYAYVTIRHGERTLAVLTFLEDVA